MSTIIANICPVYAGTILLRRSDGNEHDSSLVAGFPDAKTTLRCGLQPASAQVR